MAEISNDTTGVEIKDQQVTNVNANPVLPYDSYVELPEVNVSAPRKYRFSDNSKALTSTGDFKGWYYDDQLSNPLTSVRLLSNSQPTVKENKVVWEDLDGYDAVIMSSIINDDFSVEVSNGWDDQGGDFLSGTLNGLIKPLAPYGEVFAKAMDKIKVFNAELENDPEVSDSLAGKILTGISDVVPSDAIRSVSRLAQGAFVTQGTSFTTYGGTGINFGLLGMKFTLFPTWVNGEMVSVVNQVEKIVPYSIGNLEDVDWSGAAKVAGGAAKKLSEATNIDITKLVTKLVESDAGKEAQNAINKYLKWQRPPGGYRVDDPLNIDVESFPGTLCLEVGTHYKISNLVISNISLQFSKQMVKDPRYFNLDGTAPGEEENGLSPLYCDVNIVLRPMTKYSQQSMYEFIRGNVDTRKAVVKGMKGDLSKIREDIKGKEFDEN